MPGLLERAEVGAYLGCLGAEPGEWGQEHVRGQEIRKDVHVGVGAIVGAGKQVWGSDSVGR